MTPYYTDDAATVWHGDCREVLRSMADDSVDAICTDPPYELGFMGRTWDASGIAYNVDLWRECLRVLKPGGHLLAFGAPRTYHRLACAVEDAGFQIRDSIHWIFGGGFPKGQDIGKHIDRRRDDRADILRVTRFLSEARKTAGISVARIDEIFGFNGMASHWTAKEGKAAAVPTIEQWRRLQGVLGFESPEMDELVSELNGRKGEAGEAWADREVVGHHRSGLAHGDGSVFLRGAGRHEGDLVPVTVAASDEARRWQGWNTSLKPAHEAIVVARKSTGFNTTVANVLEWGTGALNIGGCRVPSAGGRPLRVSDRRPGNSTYGDGLHGSRSAGETTAGRWPANLVFSHSEGCEEDGLCVPSCPVAELDRQSGTRRSGGDVSGNEPSSPAKNVYGEYRRIAFAKHRDTGGASRFFPVFCYEAKASASERPKIDGVQHPTTKPLALVRWLCRLVTPPGGLVLDPFAGSGTTLEAAVVEGFRAVGVEKEADYLPLIRARLSKPLQTVLDLGEADR